MKLALGFLIGGVLHKLVELVDHIFFCLPTVSVSAAISSHRVFRSSAVVDIYSSVLFVFEHLVNKVLAEGIAVTGAEALSVKFLYNIVVALVLTF